MYADVYTNMNFIVFFYIRKTTKLVLEAKPARCSSSCVCVLTHYETIRQFMLTINFSFILRKSVNFIVLIFSSNRDRNSTNIDRIIAVSDLK